MVKHNNGKLMKPFMCVSPLVRGSFILYLTLCRFRTQYSYDIRTKNEMNGCPDIKKLSTISISTRIGPVG